MPSATAGAWSRRIFPGSWTARGLRQDARTWISPGQGRSCGLPAAGPHRPARPPADRLPGHGHAGTTRQALPTCHGRSDSVLPEAPLCGSDADGVDSAPRPVQLAAATEFVENDTVEPGPDAGSAPLSEALRTLHRRRRHDTYDSSGTNRSTRSAMHRSTTLNAIGNDVCGRSRTRA
jgi:hypothetical protein